MKKINTYGLKMKGLKKTSGQTKDHGYFSGTYAEIFYDRAQDEVWAIMQYSLRENTWTEYQDKSIIKICNTARHMTMQQIADAIIMHLEYEKHNELASGN